MASNNKPIYTIKDNEVVEITEKNIHELTPLQVFNRGSKKHTQNRLDVIQGIEAVGESFDRLIERVVRQLTKRFKSKVKG